VKRFASLLLASLVILMCGILFGIYGLFVKPYISVDAITPYRDIFLAFVQAHYGYSVAVFMLVYALAVGLSLPIGLPFTMIGGFLFGPFRATVYVVISATVGSCIAFWFARYVFRPLTMRSYGELLTRFDKAVYRYGAYYLLIAHLVPPIPVFLVNLLAGLSSISLWTFIWTTVLGLFPLTFLYAYAGDKLTNVTSWKSLLSSELILVYVVFLGVLIFSLYWQKKYDFRRK
jgi:uncharacterized membrane protein YdjX (TVP38/TMEM64 family)